MQFMRCAVVAMVFGCLNASGSDHKDGCGFENNPSWRTLFGSKIERNSSTRQQVLQEDTNQGDDKKARAKTRQLKRTLSVSRSEEVEEANKNAHSSREVSTPNKEKDSVESSENK